MPGWHFKFWIVFAVEKHPWVQVRAGEIGVVVSQVGKPLPVGAKSAHSVSELNVITDLHAWLEAGGQKGVQRPVLPPGSLMPVHPVGFLVITRERVYGVPVAQQFQRLQAMGKLNTRASAWKIDQLRVTVITPRSAAAAASSTRAASSPHWKASRCRAGPSPAGWASSRTSKSSKATRPAIHR